MQGSVFMVPGGEMGRASCAQKAPEARRACAERLPGVQGMAARGVLAVRNRDDPKPQNATETVNHKFDTLDPTHTIEGAT